MRHGLKVPNWREDRIEAYIRAQKTAYFLNLLYDTYNMSNVVSTFNTDMLLSGLLRITCQILCYLYFVTDSLVYILFLSVIYYILCANIILLCILYHVM